MAWDSSRPVPWERLMREWVIYALIMAAILLVVLRDANVVGAIAGVLISGPLYLMLGYALAKLGYRRKTMAELRTERQEKAADELAEKRVEDERAASTGPRKTPPPTKRTSRGSNRPVRRKRR